MRRELPREYQVAGYLLKATWHPRFQRHCHERGGGGERNTTRWLSLDAARAVAAATKLAHCSSRGGLLRRHAVILFSTYGYRRGLTGTGDNALGGVDVSSAATSLFHLARSPLSTLRKRVAIDDVADRVASLYTPAPGVTATGGHRQLTCGGGWAPTLQDAPLKPHHSTDWSSALRSTTARSGRRRHATYRARVPLIALKSTRVVYLPAKLLLISEVGGRYSSTLSPN